MWLDKYCCFEELTESNFYELIISPLEDAECFDHWDYASGATKLVLIFKELDYVIKIPFQGYYEYRESHWTTPSANYYNAQDLAEGYYSCNSADIRARGGVYHDESDEFYEFCGCHNSKNGWDYCLAEAEIYSQGVADNFGSMFAATILLGEVQGYPIYRQEKCEQSYIPRKG